VILVYTCRKKAFAEAECRVLRKIEEGRERGNKRLDKSEQEIDCCSLFLKC